MIPPHFSAVIRRHLAGKNVTCALRAKQDRLVSQTDLIFAHLHLYRVYCLEGHGYGIAGAFIVTLFEQNMCEDVPTVAIFRIQFYLHLGRGTLLLRNSYADFS